MELDTSAPVPPELSNINTDKQYFKMIHLGAIRIDITLKFEKKSVNFELAQGFGALTILYTLFTSIANLSDAPLSFKEMMLTDVFQSQSSIIKMIVSNIIRQAIFQFYKLIGSSDLIGNPVGFVSKLGSGFFEFFNEPRKGLLKGPKEFVGGVGKGVTALMTGIVSASFGSASKITGSCYTMFKSMSGQTAQYTKRPENVCDGCKDGTVGGVKEIYWGVTGVVTQPYTGAKTEGVWGFTKGIGKGV